MLFLMAKLDFDLAVLLKDVVSRSGSDLHLIHDLPPIVRVGGELGALPYVALRSNNIEDLLQPYMTDVDREQFRKDLRLNLGHTITEIGRFRFNVYKALGTTGATIRVIPSKIYPLSALGLPPVVGSLAGKRSGIIFVTGATGSGKSTTMAAMLEHINQTGRPGKVVTIEDPIETVFKPVRSIFVQREVGTDTPSFEIGIMDALRQDPDILCIGELREAKSIQAALLAAETGHLVLTTLHTRDASKTAQRLVSSEAGVDQEGLRDQLANTLEAVICQELLPRADGSGLVLAAEILIATPAVRQLIRANHLEAINDAIQSGAQVGMISKDIAIKTLFKKKLIDQKSALASMRNPDLLAT